MYLFVSGFVSCRPNIYVSSLAYDLAEDKSPQHPLGSSRSYPYLLNNHRITRHVREFPALRPQLNLRGEEANPAAGFFKTKERALSRARLGQLVGFLYLRWLQKAWDVKGQKIDPKDNWNFHELLTQTVDKDFNSAISGLCTVKEPPNVPSLQFTDELGFISESDESVAAAPSNLVSPIYAPGSPPLSSFSEVDNPPPSIEVASSSDEPNLQLSPPVSWDIDDPYIPSDNLTSNLWDNCLSYPGSDIIKDAFDNQVNQLKQNVTSNSDNLIVRPHSVNALHVRTLYDSPTLPLAENPIIRSQAPSPDEVVYGRFVEDRMALANIVPLYGNSPFLPDCACQILSGNQKSYFRGRFDEFRLLTKGESHDDPIELDSGTPILSEPLPNPEPGPSSRIEPPRLSVKSRALILHPVLGSNAQSALIRYSSATSYTPRSYFFFHRI